MAFASTVQFAPDECTSFPHVESRMIFACVAGSGAVEVNGSRVEVRPSTIVVMPWGHSVHYFPDERNPYLVYGVHLIPDHAAQPIELSVPHDRSHPLSGVPWRSDGPLVIGAATWICSAIERPALMTLVHYVAQVWDRGEPTVSEAVALGGLIVAELNRPDEVLAQDDKRLPVRLRQATTWVTADISRPVSVSALAAVADCSTATIDRLFRTYLGAPPMAWVLERRIDAAKRLLTTTRLSGAQISARIGFTDSAYFSRSFRKSTGLTPMQWRARWSAP